MIFWRVKPLNQILETAEKKSLKRQLGALQLTLLGIGAVIGTGIFVLTAEAGQKAGPGMMLAFVIAAVVCALAALAYAELAAMVPVSGSAYTYTYGVLGELVAWIVGWALGLEYGIGAAVVCVGWSGYMNGLLKANDIALPEFLRTGYFAGGGFDLLAFLIGLAVTVLLVIGTSKSARVNSVLVAIKIVALTVFIFLAIPAVKSSNFEPFLPGGWGNPLGGAGVLGAAASIFFAYVGFDAVSTAAEETKNPNRNIPIGLIGSLTVCTIFYLLVGYGAAGSVGAQPMLGANGLPLDPGTPAMAAACAGSEALVCSKEPLAHVMRLLGHNRIGDWIGIAAILALPSVILMMMFGQTRIFFTMSRDGLLPDALSKVHPRFHTPHVITILTGIVVSVCAALFPVGKLADTSNSGTLLAFAMVSIGVLILRKQQPDRARPFRTPFAWIVCPLAVAGCALLFVNLSMTAKVVFITWAAIGLVLYRLYGYRRSQLANQNA
ncbi:APA family basic amino acid/polyamine antiporter [Dokdonella fugitiva]|uniref:APA family basic amino acid/polyamine antiporter n=1 Tax=Dokdonella fugitiva TaxID=328517 RepID=A0A839ERQ4_9GAMM|nr:amino acid permease [Dokdonella fugitiva]MBA8886435.1 APA family basic amino acid/polyamine antiporter [Dokdonella fugitiva]